MYSCRDVSLRACRGPVSEIAAAATTYVYVRNTDTGMAGARARLPSFEVSPMRWTREIFPIKSQVGIKAANAQPTPGTQLETGNQVRSRVKPVFHRLVVGGVSFLIDRSNMPH